MNDIFKDMQKKVGCEYISDLPSYKRKVWHEMKRLNPADYEERQLEDFSKYVFGMSYQTIKDVMKQQKGREEQCIRHKLELTGESVVWSLLDETVLFSIYKVIELYFENKKGPLHFCEMALRKYSVFTK